MASIQTSIELNDQFTSVIYGVINSVNMAVSAMYDMQQSMSTDVDTSSLQGARDEINQAAAALDNLNAAAQNQTAPGVTPPAVENGSQEPISVPIIPTLPTPLVDDPPPIETPIQPNAPPEPVEIPVQWETNGLDVFTSTGIERFEQEVQSANQMLGQLSSTQDRIARQAYNTDILPPQAFRDLNRLAVQIDMVKNRIQQIENNPVNMGTDTANAEMERLRAQLNQALQAQNNLNMAMQRMDVGAVNTAYMQLSQSVNNTERYVRDNVNAQGQFNQKIQEGTHHASGLANTIKGAVAAYVSIQSVGKVLNISDGLAQSTARLDMMNDGLQSTDELVDMVYNAAQGARGLFSDMATVVSKFGNNAKDAFGSSAEVVEFASLVQKQMTIAGASTTESSNAMLQLSQALGSGVLRGDELNSIFEQAPNLIQNIADYMNAPIGQIREMAKEGELSADIVKQSIFAASDDINKKFEGMPMTWGQAWQLMKNDALKAFQPVLQRINDIANSEAFQAFANGVVAAMTIIANVVLTIFDLIGAVGNFIAKNWSIIGPIVYGVAAGLAVYATYLTIVKIAGLLATAAQMLFNGALFASPIVWIVLLIMAFVAGLIALCNWIAKTTDIASSGFGVICGSVNVAIQFFKNLGQTVANIALGIADAIGALANNMMTAFHNAICSVQSWFYNLLSTVLSVIGGIAEALNKLPFVEFDYSGVTSAADKYAAKAAEVAEKKKDYESISDAFNKGFNTYDTFKDGWMQEAFNSGADWGDNAAKKVSELFKGKEQSKSDERSEINNALTNKGVDDKLGGIADNTGAIKDSVEVTNEDLKYLRDAAERDIINRFTTAEIKVEMTNNNTINNDMDLDGIPEYLRSTIEQEMNAAAEGVY